MDSIKRTILIDDFPFTYEEEILDYETVSPMSFNEAKSLLFKTKELFEKVGLRFYLGYGTLLGAVRDHGIIPGDEDLDIIVEDENLLRSYLPFFSDNGLKVIRIFEHSTYSFRMNNNSYIDVYILRPIQGFSCWKRSCVCLSGMYTPKKYTNTFREIEFLGGNFLCFKNPEKILELWYGKTWQKPIRGHSFFYEVKSHWIWVNIFKPIIIITVGSIILWPLWRYKIRKKYQDKQSSVLEWQTKKELLKKNVKLFLSSFNKSL